MLYIATVGYNKTSSCIFFASIINVHREYRGFRIFMSGTHDTTQYIEYCSISASTWYTILYSLHGHTVRDCDLVKVRHRAVLISTQSCWPPTCRYYLDSCSYDYSPKEDLLSLLLVFLACESCALHGQRSHIYSTPAVP